MKKLNKVRIIIPIILVIATSLVFYGYNIKIANKKTIPYKSFIEEIAKGKVAKVFLSNSDKVKVVLKDGTTYYTTNPRSINFKEDLLLKGVDVEEGSGTPVTDIIPILITMGMMSIFLYFLLKSSRSKANAFKISAMDIAPENKTGITFDSIAGNIEVKESIAELVDFIKNPDKYSKYNAKMPRGVVLYGSPGTGKTLLAKALATEADVPFYAVNGSDFVQVYVGVGAGRIRDLFKKAREKGRAVIFIDEIDAIGKKRNGKADGGSDEREQTLNALLSEMSGFKESQGIIVIAATNRLDVLDEALLRPGRFDRHIEVSLPDVNARHQILKLYAESKPICDSVDLYKVAKQTVYFSGAKLENLMNEAAILAAKEGAEKINMLHIDTAFSTVLAGSEKKDRSFISKEDKEITAYHEAGHALMTKLLLPENKVSKITIIPSTKGAGGYTLNIPKDALYHTKAKLLSNIKVSLAGRAAEEIILGKNHITSGASGDIQNVTNTILTMIKNYGMFDDTGLLDYDIIIANTGYDSSQIIEKANKVVISLYAECLEQLKTNKDKLDKLACALLEKETLYEEEIDALVI